MESQRSSPPPNATFASVAEKANACVSPACSSSFPLRGVSSRDTTSSCSSNDMAGASAAPARAAKSRAKVTRVHSGNNSGRHRKTKRLSPPPPQIKRLSPPPQRYRKRKPDKAVSPPPQIKRSSPQDKAVATAHRAIRRGCHRSCVESGCYPMVGMFPRGVRDVSAERK